MMADPAPTQPQLSTRDALLTQLLSAKPDGLTLQQLGERLGITRTAIRQHVTALEKDGLVMPTGVMPTGRRPSRTYGLTDRGKETFQRRYDLLSVSMLRAMRALLGEEGAEAVLMAMADALAADWLADLAHLGGEECRRAVVKKMQQLGYHARLSDDGQNVEALNCIFHRVAAETRAVCRFDERLVTLLLGTEVKLTSCMAEGEGSCVFARNG